MESGPNHPCSRDTDGDGNCNWCIRHAGCPFEMFRQSMIDVSVITAAEVVEFKNDAQPFKYTEWLGVITGWRHRDGRVLIESMELQRRT